MDVLAVLRALVLDAAITRMHDGDAEQAHLDAECAVAAVAALVEADHELDAAYSGFPPVGSSRADEARGSERVNAAISGRIAALSAMRLPG